MNFLSPQKLAGINIILLGLLSIYGIFSDPLPNSRNLMHLIAPSMGAYGNVYFILLVSLSIFVPFFLGGKYFFKLSRNNEKTKLNSVASFMVLISSILMILSLVYFLGCDDLGCILPMFALWFSAFLMLISLLLIPIDRLIKYRFWSKEFFLSLLIFIPFIVGAIAGWDVLA